MATANYPLLRIFAPYSTLALYKGYYVGACPLCNATPAKMVVRPDQGAWHCYSCGAGGDPIDFLQSVEQLGRDQAYLLYKVLLRDEPTAGAAAGTRRVESAPLAEPPPPPAPMNEVPEPPREEPAQPARAHAATGTLADLRERLGGVTGFRGVAYFGTNGKPLLLDGLRPEELSAINAYFDNAFRAAHALLGAPAEQGVEGILQDEGCKFIRVDAPVAGSRCRVFLALDGGASEARFRMLVRNFLGSVSTPPQ